MLTAWMWVLRAAGVLVDWRPVWRRIHARVVVDGSVHWSRVLGPMGALIGTLTMFGWNMLFLDMWVDPWDTVWTVSPHVAVGPLIAVAIRSARGTGGRRQRTIIAGRVWQLALTLLLFAQQMASRQTASCRGRSARMHSVCGILVW